MAGVYGTRLFGEVDRVPGLFSVSTIFFHINYVPLVPTATYVVLEGSHTDDGFSGKKIGMSFKSVLAGYLRGWSAGVAMFAAGVAGLGGMAFFTGNQGGIAVLGAFVSAIAIAFAFWFVVISRSWMLSILTYLALAGLSAGVWLVVLQAIQQNPALEQAKAKEIATLPALLVALIAAAIGMGTKILSGCSYERALVLAQELGIDQGAIASHYGAIVTPRDQFQTAP